jgi:hypothetical protein
VQVKQTPWRISSSPCSRSWGLVCCLRLCFSGQGLSTRAAAAPSVPATAFCKQTYHGYQYSTFVRVKGWIRGEEKELMRHWPRKKQTHHQCGRLAVRLFLQVHGRRTKHTFSHFRLAAIRVRDKDAQTYALGELTGLRLTQGGFNCFISICPWTYFLYTVFVHSSHAPLKARVFVCGIYGNFVWSAYIMRWHFFVCSYIRNKKKCRPTKVMQPLHKLMSHERCAHMIGYFT